MKTLKTWELLEALQVKRYINNGICGNIVCFGQKVAKDTDKLFDWHSVKPMLKQAFREWPEFSGDEDFPIRDPKQRYIPETAFHHYSPWGKSAYAAKRFELLAYLIAYFRELDQ